MTVSALTAAADRLKTAVQRKGWIEYFKRIACGNMDRSPSVRQK
jgi:hypothetical protein